MLVSDILANAALDSDMEVKVSENRGHAQRGGSVSAHVRIGSCFSPTIPLKKSDVILGLEPLEALRNISILKPDGFVVMDKNPTIPFAFHLEKIEYPDIDFILKKFEEITKNIRVLDAVSIAKSGGNVLTKNSVMLGVLCSLNDFPIPIEKIKINIRKFVPKGTEELNIKAFDMGHSGISQE